MNEASTRPHRPTGRIASRSAIHFAVFCAAAALVIAFFFVVYFGCDYLTGLRQQRVRLDFAFEQHVPFFPALTIVYSSLFLMLSTLPLVLKDQQEIWRFAWLMIAATLVAGVCFLVLPAEIHFDRNSDLGRFASAFQIADALNLTYNLFPSLHVTYAVLCAAVVRQKNARLGRPFHAWALAITISAWLTHQHHLLDLAGGYVLGLTAASIANHRRWFLPNDHADRNGCFFA